jgi:CHASE2 domain-containing sensor protein
MTQIRRPVRCICAVVLTIGSIIALVYLLFYADGFFPSMPMMAAVLAIVGLSWLWEDFINADPRSKE